MRSPSNPGKFGTPNSSVFTLKSNSFLVSSIYFSGTIGPSNLSGKSTISFSFFLRAPQTTGRTYSILLIKRIKFVSSLDDLIFSFNKYIFFINFTKKELKKQPLD
jgi:hypothetical protein